MIQSQRCPLLSGAQRVSPASGYPLFALAVAPASELGDIAHAPLVTVLVSVSTTQQYGHEADLGGVDVLATGDFDLVAAVFDIMKILEAVGQVPCASAVHRAAHLGIALFARLRECGHDLADAAHAAAMKQFSVKEFGSTHVQGTSIDQRMRRVGLFGHWLERNGYGKHLEWHVSAFHGMDWTDVTWLNVASTWLDGVPWLGSHGVRACSASHECTGQGAEEEGEGAHPRCVRAW